MKLNTKPLPEQRKAGVFLLNRPSGLCTYATGTGKSYIQILTCLYLLHHRVVNHCLIVGTINACISISKEFRKRTGEEIAILSTPEELIQFLNGSRGMALMRYDLHLELDVGAFRYLTAQRKICWCFDEAHTLKTRSAKVTQFFMALRPWMTRCYGFTATPITSMLEDLYYIADFLQPGILGNRTWFRKNFLVIETRTKNDGSKYWEVVQFKQLDYLKQLLQDLIITHFPKRDIRFLEDHLNLHPSTQPRYLAAARGILDEWQKRKPGESQKQHSSRMWDLQRVVDTDPNKINLYKQRVHDKLDQGIVTYVSTYDTYQVILKSLREEGLKRNTHIRRISGRDSAQRRSVNEDWFTEDPSGKVLVLTPAGAQSLNLQVVDEILLYNIPFGIGPFCQLIGRIVRLFSPYDTHYVRFLGLAGTIDEYKMNYVQAQSPHIRKLFNNELVPPSAFKGYNSYVMRALRRNLCWK